MTLAERMAAAGPDGRIEVTDDELEDLHRRSRPRVMSSTEGPLLRVEFLDADDRIIAVDTAGVASIGRPRATLAPIDASDPVAVRRRALFDRIIAMDLSQLAAMERCAGMIEGRH